MQILNPEFRKRVNTLLEGFIVRFYAESPAARHLREAAAVDSELFKAHTVQTILRIRLARMADAKAVLLFTKSDPAAAQKWAQYTEEEMLHDRLFLKDLRRLGMEEAEVYATPPFLATRLLQGYLYFTLEHEGPMGLLTKAYFLEYTSRATQSEWNANVRKSLGDDAVRRRGAHQHRRRRGSRQRGVERADDAGERPRGRGAPGGAPAHRVRPVQRLLHRAGAARPAGAGAQPGDHRRRALADRDRSAARLRDRAGGELAAPCPACARSGRSISSARRSTSTPTSSPPA
jgi:hypothetical protein